MVKHRLPLDDWFDDPPPPHPYDSWPSATYEGEWLPENGEEPPRPEEDIAGWFKDETEPLDIPIEETLHQKMYEIATSKYNPFAVGGSENIHDFDRKD